MRKFSGLCGALILALATASCGGATGPGANTVCATASNTFNPAGLTVTAGTTVTWQNDTGVLHNVTWNDAAGRAAATAGDGSGDITDFTGSHTRLFSAAGTYAFHCTIHPGMNGTLTVN